MSSEARTMLASLEAAETFLRVLASNNLEYARVMAVEKRAMARCNELLDELGHEAPFAIDDATEELLKQAVDVQPVVIPGPQGVQEPLDVGAEGTAAETYSVHTDESEELTVDPSSEASVLDPAVFEEDILDEVSDEGLVVEVLDDAATEGGLAIDAGDDDSFAFISVDDVERIEDDATSATMTPSFVTFDDDDDDDDDVEVLTYGDDGPAMVITGDGPDADAFDDDTPTPVPVDRASFVVFDDDDEDAPEELVLDEEPEEDGFADVDRSGHVAILKTEDSEHFVDDLSGLLLEEDDSSRPTQTGARISISLGAASADDDDDDLLELDDDDVVELDDEAMDVSDDDGDLIAIGEPPEGDVLGYSDVGSDALITFDEDIDTLDEFADGEDTNLDLGPDDDAFADEEATLVASTDDIDAMSAKASTGAAGPVAVQIGGVTSGVYGDPGVPMIRDGSGPRPRAAAIQINQESGTSQVLGMEEEEEILEIGGVEDYGEDVEDFATDDSSGFSLNVQEYDDDDDDDEQWEDDDELSIEMDEQPTAPTLVRPSDSEVAKMLEEAAAATDRSDLHGAADLYSDVLDADPDNVQAAVSRGRLYLDLGDFARAMSDFVAAEDLAPEDPEPKIAVGDLYFARKDYRKAIDYFNTALGLAPNHAMAFCRRGISHYYRKNYSAATTDLRKAKKLDPDIPNIETYIGMARKKTR